jgi:uncharacterized alkaline shock family protein YloU
MADIESRAERQDKVKIADEVIMTIAGIAAAEVEGVVSLSGGLADGIAGILGKKNPGKGVKVEVGDREVVIDLSIVVEYGCRIHLVAKEIQDRIRKVVEDMTGMSVAEVNVHILGVNIGKELKKEEIVES